MNHLASLILVLLPAVFAHEDESFCATYQATKADYCGLSYFKEYCPHMCDEYIDNTDLDGNWGHWSPWGPCDNSCGSGSQTSTRQCNNPAPKHAGATCPGAGSKTQGCNDNSGCPVNGVWGAWTLGPCSATCGAGNTRTKTRACDSPPPSNGGASCSTTPTGATTTGSDGCNTNDCPVDAIENPWGEWSAQCSATCGELGTNTRTRTCTPAQFGGTPCGPATETRSCNVKVCPINGGYTTWSTWSNCANSGSCGRGYRYKTRCCTNPTPAHGGTNCDSIGLPIEIESCRLAAPCALDGQWSTWGAYAACTLSCGTGSETRTRVCDYPKPRYTGVTCSTTPLGTTETQDCNTNACPVDGSWTEWTTWSTTSCTADCKMYIRRCCFDPAPSNGGATCPGNGWSEKTCNPGEGLCPT